MARIYVNNYILIGKFFRQDLEGVREFNITSAVGNAVAEVKSEVEDDGCVDGVLLSV